MIDYSAGESFVKTVTHLTPAHLTAFGVVRGGHLAEKVVFRVSYLAIIGGR